MAVRRLLRFFLGFICSSVLTMVLVLLISPKMTVSAPSSPVFSVTMADAQLESDRPQYTASVFSNWIELYKQKAKAPVILDGEELFFVTDTGEYTAKLRTELINAQLEQAAASPGEFEVEVEQSNHLTIISLNDEQLLTVTAVDAAPKSPEVRAEEWAEKISESLKIAKEQRSFDFIFKALIYSAAIAIAALGIQSLLDEFLKKFWQRFDKKEPTDNTEETQAVKSLHLASNLTRAIARFLIWSIAVLGISNLFPLTRQLSYQLGRTLVNTLTSPILTLGQKAYSVPDLLILFSLLCGLIVVSRKVSNLLKSRILEITGINRGAQEAIASIIRYSTIAIGTVVILQIWGLDLSSVTILVSALGVGIGLGFQDIAKNFASGLILLFERPIQVGDFVEVDRYTGIVEYIGARSTTIRTLDRISIILPNSRFLESEVINWSHRNPVSRLHVPVGVAYGCDINAVRSTLLEAAKSHPLVLLVPSPRVMFIGFGDNSLDFDLLVWIDRPSELFFIKSDLYFRIESLLRDRNIEIPFPQRDLHVRSGSLPLQLSSELEQALLQLLQKFVSKNSDD